jgi:phage repressor protein C with HTH and peptisase S24 domain
LGIEQPRVSEMRRGKRRPQSHELRIIAEYLEKPLPSELMPENDTMTKLPVLAMVSAGRLSDSRWDGEVLRYVAIGGLENGSDWIGFIVEGDSMDRISPPGSVVVVDRKDRKLVPNACYVIADLEGAASYKRFRPNPTRFEPVSTNANHETIFPDGNIKIIGRVRRSLLEM